jgi:hypothetical protein
VVHVLAVIADSYVDFSLVNVLVPLTWKALPPFRNGPALVHDGSMWPRTRG